MRKITVEEAREKLAANDRHVTVVDARSADAWNKAEVKGGGAIRIPPDDVGRPISDISRDDFILIYCT